MIPTKIAAILDTPGIYMVSQGGFHFFFIEVTNKRRVHLINSITRKSDGVLPNSGWNLDFDERNTVTPHEFPDIV